MCALLACLFMRNDSGERGTKRIVQMLVNAGLFALSLIVIGSIYVNLFEVSAGVLAVFFVILILYGFCVAIGGKGMTVLDSYERKAVHFGLTQKDNPKILASAVAALTPTYFYVLLVSLVPISSYESWLFVVFPCIVANCLPAVSIMGEYRSLTHKRFPFAVSFLTLSITACLIGATISTLTFNYYI